MTKTNIKYLQERAAEIEKQIAITEWLNERLGEGFDDTPAIMGKWRGEFGLCMIDVEHATDKDPIQTVSDVANILGGIASLRMGRDSGRQIYFSHALESTDNGRVKEWTWLTPYTYQVESHSSRDGKDVKLRIYAIAYDMPKVYSRPMLVQVTMDLTPDQAGVNVEYIYESGPFGRPMYKGKFKATKDGWETINYSDGPKLIYETAEAHSHNS